MNIKLKHSLIVALLFLSAVFTQVAKASTVTIEAEKQDFKVETNTASFIGNVRVKYENIKIFSPLASLISNDKGEPDRAVFSNGASAQMTQPDANGDLTADQITLFLASNELLAQGNTFTKITRKSPGVITVKADEQKFNNKTREVDAKGNIVIHYKDSVISGSQAKLINSSQGKPLKASISGGAKFTQGNSTVRAGSISVDLNTSDVTASGGVNTITTLKGTGKVTMRSATQVYNKAANTLTGKGSVNMTYQDYTATGPQAVLYLGPNNSLKEIIFTGRSQINDSIRKVSADRIKVTIDPKNFYAEGNVKTQFKQVTKPAEPSQTPAPAATEAPVNNATTSVQAAPQPETSTSQEAKPEKIKESQ